MQERKQTVLARGWVKKKKREKQEMGRGGAQECRLTCKPVKKSKRCGCSQCPGQGHREHAGYPKAHFRSTVPPTPLSTTLRTEKSYNHECPDLLLDFSSQFCPSTTASVGTLQSSALPTRLARGGLRAHQPSKCASSS